MRILFDKSLLFFSIDWNEQQMTENHWIGVSFHELVNNAKLAYCVDTRLGPTCLM